MGKIGIWKFTLYPRIFLPMKYFLNLLFKSGSKNEEFRRWSNMPIMPIFCSKMIPLAHVGKIGIWKCSFLSKASYEKYIFVSEYFLQLIWVYSVKKAFFLESKFNLSLIFKFQRHWLPLVNTKIKQHTIMYTNGRQSSPKQQRRTTLPLRIIFTQVELFHWL